MSGDATAVDSAKPQTRASKVASRSQSAGVVIGTIWAAISASAIRDQSGWHATVTAMESLTLVPELFELRRIRMPLVRPFRTSFGTETVREVILVHVITDRGEGWGECAIESAPLYLSEFLDAAELVMADHLAPRLFGAGPLRAERVADALEEVKGHRIAKSAMEMAI